MKVDLYMVVLTLQDICVNEWIVVVHTHTFTHAREAAVSHSDVSDLDTNSKVLSKDPVFPVLW